MLKVNAISFAYGKEPILDDISFIAKKGEHLAVVGESGSGKTTLLKLIYGEYDLNHGSIFWNDNQILGPKFNLVIGQDYMKYVAQEFDLMPYTSVAENIGKYLSNFHLEQKAARIKTLLKVVELEPFETTKIQFLSGGQKQRVALAQAIAKEPEIILLDEPFSHIDNFKKQSLRRNLFNHLKEKQITCVIATHDKNDVLSFSDQMIVLNKGKVITSGSPDELYHNPKTSRIASFFGEHNVTDAFGLVYANQLKVSDNSNLRVTVKRSYFNGPTYLIEAVCKDQTIFFENPEALAPNSKVYLSRIL